MENNIPKSNKRIFFEKIILILIVKIKLIILLKNSRPNIKELIKCLRRKKPDYIPLMELGVHPIIKEKILGRKSESINDEIEFSLKMGYDYIKLQPIADFNPAKIGVEKDFPFDNDGTPKRKWASEGIGLISDDESFQKYIFPTTEDFNYDKFKEVKRILPANMGIIGQYGDIFTMTWEIMGFENFSICLFENEELIEKVNNKIGNLVLSMFEFFAQSKDVDIIWYSDDIAYTNGLMVSPDVLDKYFFPWIKKIGELSNKSNKPFIYHSDGILYSVIDRLIECGIDALHPIEPKAMDLLKLKNEFGDQLCLIGNIDVDLLSRGTEEEVKKVVLENINNVGLNGGYCVGSGNSIPEYVKVENYIVMNKTVMEFNHS